MAMKLVSWNVNGLRAISQKEGFWGWLEKTDADLVAFQETKASPDQLADDLLNPGSYLSYWASALDRKGYSGVVTYTKEAPLSISEELPKPQWRGEGRLINLEFPHFYFINVYIPNSQKDHERLQYKLGFYEACLDYAQELRRKKPVVIGGDFNVAHRPIDIAGARENEPMPGFLPEERAWMDKFHEAGYTDCFRHIHGPETVAYSWWSLRSHARSQNIGWRIDYFLVSSELKEAIKDAWIDPKVEGSDHCPVGLELAI